MIGKRKLALQKQRTLIRRDAQGMNAIGAKTCTPGLSLFFQCH